ncbi:MAG TPA: SDR family NAD(P)-dependent oxidoreductase [Pseudomonadales bacterium]|jgi:NAD(P)-dependent dehydrogenase (short-subunit alcohol dehydrogenase family)|nr:short-chain dehydrogenase [Gammaproteobacteria bacterium]MDP6027471.1 SDR family NAD(P)-dependent oxidoreductase [Pseudomonadales bacterium]MDP6315440.1 SDR family NAD(P)-dependent oxidoreductase [Pseudomonadales bacterium]MDP7315103.1 SDR family NAD(P)-dependent oxidoreductase [Pseudomonadales bacterium]HJL61017.1 SDR family NAD(P)-dependent oxidoreductase [Pseudomonadales bacterium]|tara:strand:- start:6068 stop:6874 length:807 start_codon:yes stop_codon:yes gene_type:complete
MSNNSLLAGKVAVVTGASRGIGEAIAIRYAMEGARVIVSARTLDDGDHVLEGSINSVVKRIQDMGGEAHALRCDLAIEAHRENLIRETEAVFGPVDILVNNAAVTYFVPVEQFKKKHYDLMLEVQVYAPFHLVQLCLPGMIERKSGWILNISSHAAIHPAKDTAGRGGTVYGMCKAALERFTTGLAAEVYEHGIGVNVISPGLVATPGVVYHNLITDNTPKEMITPVEHMAEACLRLVHGDANDITGKITYAVDVLKDYKLEPADLGS